MVANGRGEGNRNLAQPPEPPQGHRVPPARTLPRTSALAGRLGLACSLLVGAGCAGTFKDLGAELGQGLGKGLLTSVNADGPKAVTSLLTAAGEGVRTQVLTAETNKQLETAVTAAATAAVTAAVGSAREQVPGLREELIGKQTEAQLQATLGATLAALLKQLDAQAQLTSRGIIREASLGVEHDLMGLRNQERLNEILASLGKTAQDQTGQLKNQLLTGNDEQVRLIVGSAMKEVVNASEDIRLKAHQELSFVQKNALESVVLATVLGGAVIFLFWRQNQKNRMLLELVMSQLHAGSKEAENDLLGKVGEKAVALGVERQLVTLKALAARFGGKAPPPTS